MVSLSRRWGRWTLFWVGEEQDVYLAVSVKLAGVGEHSDETGAKFGKVVMESQRSNCWDALS